MEFAARGSFLAQVSPGLPQACSSLPRLPSAPTLPGYPWPALGNLPCPACPRLPRDACPSQTLFPLIRLQRWERQRSATSHPALSCQERRDSGPRLSC